MTFQVSILLCTAVIINYSIGSLSFTLERSSDESMLYSDKIFDTTECKIEFDTILQKEVYTYVDQMPEFPGGPKAMNQFLKKNFKLNTVHDSMRYNIDVAFVIETDGKVKDAYTIRPYCVTSVSLLDTELLRIVKLMPNWNSGICNQKKVAVKFVIPIRF